MTDLVTYSADGGVATITLDDGKVNALSVPMLRAIDAALDQAEADDAIVVLRGREGILSAGFDLKTMAARGEDALTMLRTGFEVAARVLSFPRPVVIACTGHAMAMGAFLLLSGDYRIGVEGPYKLTANEVKIGLTMPLSAIAIMRQRVPDRLLTRSALLAEVFSPADAVAAGFLDRVVPVDGLDAAVSEAVAAFAELNRDAHAASKLRVRKATLEAIAEGIATEFPLS